MLDIVQPPLLDREREIQFQLKSAKRASAQSDASITRLGGSGFGGCTVDDRRGPIFRE